MPPFPSRLIGVPPRVADTLPLWRWIRQCNTECQQTTHHHVAPILFNEDNGIIDTVILDLFDSDELSYRKVRKKAISVAAGLK